MKIISIVNQQGGAIMKMRKAVLALVVLMVLVFMQGQAEAYIYSGNVLVDLMRENDKFDIGAANADLIKVGRYVGYIVGVVDAIGIIVGPMPTGVTVGQMCSIVSKYLKNHPERWNETAYFLVIDALKEAFPEKK